MRWANPSTMAVLPTPGPPKGWGSSSFSAEDLDDALDFFSRPISGSNCAGRAMAVRSRAYSAERGCFFCLSASRSRGWRWRLAHAVDVEAFGGEMRAAVADSTRRMPMRGARSTYWWSIDSASWAAYGRGSFSISSESGDSADEEMRSTKSRSPSTSRRICFGLDVEAGQDLFDDHSLPENAEEDVLGLDDARSRASRLRSGRRRVRRRTFSLYFRTWA